MARCPRYRDEFWPRAGDFVAGSYRFRVPFPLRGRGPGSQPRIHEVRCRKDKLPKSGLSRMFHSHFRLVWSEFVLARAEKKLAAFAGLMLAPVAEGWMGL